MGNNNSFINGTKKYKEDYYTSLDDLYSNKTISTKNEKKITNEKNKLINDSPFEDFEQIKAATWLTKNNILFYHVPNGGSRNMIEGVKLKRMGVKSGVPDICVPIARKGYHGLYCELKRLKGGKVSDSQKFWLEQLSNEGYYVFVSRGSNDFIQRVKDYIGCNT